MRKVLKNPPLKLDSNPLSFSPAYRTIMTMRNQSTNINIIVTKECCPFISILA
jgi:hypothetical protein